MPRTPALLRSGGSTVTGCDEGDWIQCEVWPLPCGDATVGRNGMMRCERLIGWSLFPPFFFGRCQAPEFLEWRLIDFGIGRCSGLWYLFTWHFSGFSGFCEATCDFKMHRDRSCLDVTSQDLGVLQSSWPTAAMAPHQQWLSQGMVKREEAFRQFLGSSGSGWRDEKPRVANVRWNLKWLITGWEWYKKSTVETHWKHQLLKLLTGERSRPTL